MSENFLNLNSLEKLILRNENAYWVLFSVFLKKELTDLFDRFCTLVIFAEKTRVIVFKSDINHEQNDFKGNE